MLNEVGLGGSRTPGHGASKNCSNLESFLPFLIFLSILALLQKNHQKVNMVKNVTISHLHFTAQIYTKNLKPQNM